MTARHPETAKPELRQPFVLPDPPVREPEDMTSFKHLATNGNVHHLIHHLGNPETTVFAGERFLVSDPGAPANRRRVPDLLIAFDADPDAYDLNNGYIVSVQGKPPDFVLEIASPSTAREDITGKREFYESLGVREYWRFDETGQLHGTPLAGDRLVDNRYEPIPIETLADGALQGYSPALNLLIRWEQGQLRWHDPTTGQHIATFEQAIEAYQQEREARQQAEDARDAAQARIRELEAALARRKSEE